MSNLYIKTWTENDYYNVSDEFNRIEEILVHCIEAIDEDVTKNVTMTSGISNATINGLNGYYARTTINIGANNEIVSISGSNLVLDSQYNYDSSTGDLTIEAITQNSNTLVAFVIDYVIKSGIEYETKVWTYSDIPYQIHIRKYVDTIKKIINKLNGETQTFTQTSYFNLKLANELEQGLQKCLNLVQNI